MAVEQLLQYVHPDAVYRRVPLPDEQNALSRGHRAIIPNAPPNWPLTMYTRILYYCPEEPTISAKTPVIKGDIWDCSIS